MDDGEVTVLKAIADNTRFSIIKLLLRHHFCVRALARHLNLTEAAISQHLKILREAGLVSATKCGYFMHYQVNCDRLTAIAKTLESLAKQERMHQNG